MKESEDELSMPEREAFDSLPREKKPPAYLEERIVSELKRSRLIRSPKPSWLWSPSTIGYFAAASLLLILGFALGIWWGAEPSRKDNLPDFMLVLRSSSQDLSNRSPDESLQRFREYSAWAAKARSESLLLGGEELKPEARFLKVVNGHAIVSGDEAELKERMVAGYFLIRARDPEQAITIAEGCPCLKYGSTIEIRQIERRGSN